MSSNKAYDPSSENLGSCWESRQDIFRVSQSNTKDFFLFIFFGV